MALFDNGAKEFIDKLQNINASGIVELTQMVENLTKKASECEAVFAKASSEGIALTKRQRNEYKAYTADIQNAVTAQKAIEQAIRDTWEASKKAPKGSAEKQQLAEKINLYRELQKQVASYGQSASATSKAGYGVRNKKATEKTNSIEKETNDVRVLNDEIDKVDGKPIDINTESVKNGIDSLDQKIKETELDLQNLIQERTAFLENFSDDEGYGLPELFSNENSEMLRTYNSLISEIKYNLESLKDQKLGIEIAKQEEQSPLQQPYDTSWIAKEAESLKDLNDMYADFYQRYVELDALRKKGTISEGDNKELQETVEILNEINRLKSLPEDRKPEKFKESPQTSQNVAEDEPAYTSLTEIKEALSEAKAELESLQQKASSGVTIDVDGTINEINAVKRQIKELEGMRKTLEGSNSEKDYSNRSTVYQDPNLASKLGGSSEYKVANRNNSQFRFNTATPLGGEVDKHYGENNFDFKKPLVDIEKLKTAISSLPAILSGARSAFATFSSAFSKVSSIGQTVFSTFKSIGSAATTLGSTLAHVASSGFSAMASATTRTLGTMKNLVSSGFNGVRRGASVVSSTFQRISSTMHGLTKKATPSLLKSFSSLKSMMMRRIKRTFISAIFNQAKEGLQQYAKYSSEFNASMSSIKNASKTTAGNLSVTLGNLVNTLAPVLTTLISYLNKATTAINSFFAILNGKTTVTTAKDATDDYAKSLGKASGSASDLNKQLYGFDEITRQDSSSGSSSKIEYQESQIDSTLSSFFNSLLSAFDSGKFEEVGALIAEKFNEIIGSINDFLVDIRDEATEWTSNIARILNGLVDNIDWDLLGDTIGNGLNLAFDVVNTFLTTFDWANLGTKLADGVNSIFDTVEWDLVGETFANYYNAIFQTLGNFFEELDWDAIGSDLATGVESFFNNIDWDSWKKMWSEGLNGAFSLIETFFSDVDWASIAEDIDDNLTDLVENKIDWEQIKKGLSAMVSAVQDVFHVLADSDFFTSLASQLGGLVGGVLNDIDWDTLTSDISTGIAKLKRAFWNFITELNITNLTSRIASAINGMFTNQSVLSAWDNADAKATEGINQIIDAFTNLISGPPDGIDFDNIASTIGERVGELLSSINWSDLVYTILSSGTRLGGAFYLFIERLNLSETASKIAEGVNQFFSASEGGKAPLEEAAERAGAGVKSINDAFTTFLDDLDLDTIGSTISESIQTFFNESDFDEALGRIGKFAINAVSEFFKIVSQVFTGTDDEGNKIGETLGEKLANGINNIFKKEDGTIDTEMFFNLGKNLGEAVKGILSDIASFFDKTDWEAIGESIGTAIANIDWLGLAEKLLTLLYNALIAVADTLGGALSNIVASILGINTETARQDYIDAATQTANDCAEATTEKFIEVMNQKKGDEQAKQAVVDAMAEYFNVSSDQIKEETNMLALVADVLNFGDSDALISQIEANGGVTAIATALAETLNISQEEAMASLGDYGIAQNIADTLGISFEDAMNILSTDASSRAEYLVSAYGISIDEALALLGQDDVYANELSRILGISIEDAATLLENDDAFNALSEVLGDGSEEAKEKFMEGLYLNSDSEESIKEYFKSFGVEIGDELAASLVGAKPAIRSESREMLYALVEDSSIDEIKETFKQYGIDVSDEFAESIQGQGLNNIDAALALLGAGIDESTISALDISHLSENLEAYITEADGNINTAIIKLLANAETNVTEASTTIGDKAGEAIGSAVPDATERALNKGMNLIEEKAKEVADAAAVTESDTQSAKEAGEKLGSESTGGIAEKTEEGKEGVEKATEGITTTVEEAYKKLPDDVKPYADTLMQYIVASLEDKDGTVKTAIESVAQAAVERAKEILSGEVGTEIANTFLTGIKDGFKNDADSDDGAVSSAKSMAITAKDGASENLSKDNGTSIGTEFVEGISEGFTTKDIADEANTFADSAYTKASENLSNSNGNTVGTDFVTGISDGFDSVDVNSKAEQISDNAYTSMGNKLTYSNGYSLSYYIMEGIVAGFKNNEEAVLSWAKKVANDLVTTMKTKLGIASPSKVFKEIGAYTMEGMEIGLEDAGENAVNAVGNVANAIAEEAQNTDSVDMTVNAMASGLDAVTDKMSRIAQIFSDIADTIADMGGLEIPTVATGRVIPYKTKVDTSRETYGTETMNSHSLEDAIYSAFTRAMGNESNQQPIEVKLVVDGRTLADIVTKKQREQERAWGV